MPDKIEKYLIDKELIDSGWANMQAILDREMPVTQQRRRIVPFWWWSAGLAVAAMLLAGLFVLRESNSNSTNIATNKAAEQSEKITIQPSNLSERTAAEATNSIISPTKNDTRIDKTNTPTLTTSVSKNETKKQVKATQNIAKSAILVAENATKNELAIGDDKNTTPSQIITQSADSELVKKEETIQKIDRIGVETPEILTQNAKKLNPLAANMFVPAFAKMVIKTPKQRAFQHALFARFNYVGLIDNGYSYGYMLRKNLKGRHGLQMRLFAERNTRFVHTVSETYTIPKDLLVKSTSANPATTSIDTTFSQIVYPFSENCACAAIARANNYSATYTNDNNTYVLLNSTHLGLGANYTFRLNPRWELSGGLGFSRSIREIQYSVAISNSSNAVFSEVKTPAQDPNNTTPTRLDQYKKLLQDDTEQIFNRIDGYWEFGMNFYVTKRFVIGGSYRRGIIDITKNDALGKKDFNKFGVMQGIFYF